MKKLKTLVTVINHSNDNDIQPTTYTPDMGMRVVALKKLNAISTKVVVPKKNNYPNENTNCFHINAFKPMTKPHQVTSGVVMHLGFTHKVRK